MFDPTSDSDDAQLYGNSVSGVFDCAAETIRVTPSNAVWEPPAPEHLALLLPEYEIVRFIGRGGMGAVYQGTQRMLKRQVAIKLLPSELAANPQFVTRFEREAQTLARLQHPGIVTIYEFGRTEEGHLFFVMEFVDGADLHHLIHGPGLEPQQALELTVQICEALHYAHEQGVIHRDIKPPNVLINKEGKAKLADFGLARPLVPENTATMSQFMGTLNYMAPEQFGGKADQRADIFALGVMLYEMLTGTFPVGAFDLPSLKSKVDSRIDQVVLKAMRQEPERRYQQVSELREEVEHIRSTKAGDLRPALTRRPTSKFSLTMWATALVLVAGLLYLGNHIIKGRKASPLANVLSMPTDTEGVVRQSAKANGISIAMLPAAYRAKPTLDNAYADLVEMDRLAANEQRKYQDALATINHLTNFKQTPVREGTSEHLECMAASKQISQSDSIIKLCNTERPKLVQIIRQLGGDPADAEAHCAKTTQSTH